MYRKNLVKTITLASIISISMSGCGGCGKEEVVSTLENTTSIVASIEDKQTEVVDQNKASVKPVETPVSTDVPAVTPEKEETTSIDKTEPVSTVNPDELLPENEFMKLSSDDMYKYFEEVLCDENGNSVVSDETWDYYENLWLKKMEQEAADLINAHIAEQEAKAANQEYDGPHPTGPKNPGYTMGDPVEYTIDRGLTGNVS